MIVIDQKLLPAPKKDEKFSSTVADIVLYDKDNKELQPSSDNPLEFTVESDKKFTNIRYVIKIIVFLVK